MYDFKVSYSDLRNTKSFPSFKGCPQESEYEGDEVIDHAEAHWCFLAEIVEDISADRQVIFRVKDKDGKNLRVLFDYYGINHQDIQVGQVIAVLYAERCEYVEDGDRFTVSQGLQLEYPGFVKVRTLLPLKCSRVQLISIQRSFVVI